VPVESPQPGTVKKPAASRGWTIAVALVALLIGIGLIASNWAAILGFLLAAFAVWKIVEGVLHVAHLGFTAAEAIEARVSGKRYRKKFGIPLLTRTTVMVDVDRTVISDGMGLKAGADTKSIRAITVERSSRPGKAVLAIVSDDKYIREVTMSPQKAHEIQTWMTATVPKVLAHLPPSQP
jgi:hypothetical protein